MFHVEWLNIPVHLHLLIEHSKDVRVRKKVAILFQWTQFLKVALTTETGIEHGGYLGTGYRTGYLIPTNRTSRPFARVHTRQTTFYHKNSFGTKHPKIYFGWVNTRRVKFKTTK